jgi:hypothetical protein
MQSAQPPIPSTPSSRRPPSFAAALAVAALAAFTLVPTGAQAQLVVTGIDPAGALPTEPVTLFGAGFGQTPEALFCWVDTGSGGLPFEVEKATDQQIDAVVGEVPSAATGAVTVWTGERYSLADRVVLSQGRLFSVSASQVFVTGAGAVGPVFSAFGGSPGTFGSVRVQGELRIDVDPIRPPPDGGAQRVRVTAVIETGSDSGNGTPGNLRLPPNGIALRAGEATGPSWAATLTIEADAAPPTPEALAAGLAEAIEAQLGSLGLTARAEGTELVIGHTRGIRAGFVNLLSSAGP